MENASKALLIAGGILLLIILVSLMLFVKGNISDYYASEEELKMIADTTKFNEQFSRFNREDVQGYELISLINKVVDYNERLSTEGSNDVKAEPITVNITLWNNSSSPTKSETMKELTYNNKDATLFTSQTITQSDTNNQLDNIFSGIKTLESSNANISKLTKKITSIFIDGQLNIKSDINSYFSTISAMTPDEIESERIKMLAAIKACNTCLGYNKYIPTKEADSREVFITYRNMITDLKTDVYTYYEYTQFKKAYFKCTNLVYDTTTGKVTNLNFAFTGKIE